MNKIFKFILSVAFGLIIYFNISSCENIIEKPIACISASNLNPNVGDTVTFYCCGRASHYEWQFQDGGPNSYTARPMHVFKTAGTYNVGQTVWNNGKAATS